MEADPRLNDLRKELRRRKLGPDACCTWCSESNPTVINIHVIPGRNNDPAMQLMLCQNCHAKAHEALRDAGVPLRRDQLRTVPERAEAVLRALATFFELLSRALDAWAARLG